MKIRIKEAVLRRKSRFYPQRRLLGLLWLTYRSSPGMVERRLKISFASFLECRDWLVDRCMQDKEPPTKPYEKIVWEIDTREVDKMIALYKEKQLERTRGFR